MLKCIRHYGIIENKKKIFHSNCHILINHLKGNNNNNSQGAHLTHVVRVELHAFSTFGLSVATDEEEIFNRNN
jgi:hypothetical protein